VRQCTECGGAVERTFRFCPWCAQPQRSKLVEFFLAHPGIERDHGKALRVSRYLATGARHVRFSVWNEAGEAEGAVSLTDAETERLRRFLGSTTHASLLGQLRLGARKTVERLAARS
jgi:hypothetical protein